MRIRILLLFLILIFFQNKNAKAQQAPVDLYVGNSFGMRGDTVSIDIKVNKFTNIISFQASLNWDAGLLKYINVSDFGIKDLSENNFGIIKADQGHVRFLWEPSNATALTVEDSTILFSAQFEIITNTPQEVLIDFIDNISTPAYPIEFANSTYEILTVNTHAGNIKVISDLKDLVNLESTPFSSCDEKAPNGSLKADVNGDSVNYTFHWFNGNLVTSTPDYIGHRYNNIPAGDYTLQIFDGNNELFVESISATVLDESNQQKDVISIISTIPQTSCSTSPEKQTGSIEINVNDAQLADTYLISWWEGRFEDNQELTDFRDLYKAEKLFAGDFEVAVENLGNGCKAYLKETVMEEKVDVQITLSSTENNFCKNAFNGSASVSITNPNNLDPRYYWFFASDEIDTAKARFTGQDYENIKHGNYKVWVINLNSDCFALDSIVVEQNELYSEAFITQKNDTLFANDDRANWFRNDSFLQKTGLYLIPEASGLYYISINNEYGCLSTSENMYFGITGLEELNKEITLFPNPFNEFIRVSNSKGLLEFVKIFDMQGALISENYNIKNKFIDIYLSGSSNGIYLIKIRKDGKLLTWKVVKNLSK
ncbi:MAG: T9SS type A sorting domain-containing protein [Cyclobacteriaceae bacterium]|nr:T9SS type A sorting domain-containing protein [Cyclobacteriaceae bacterium]